MASKYAPVITAAGITSNTFAQNLAYLTADYQTIFGSDVYLGNDSQDGQFIAILAQAFTDLGDAAVAVYNSFSPATAVGAGLSSIVKLNGLGRLVPSSSTVGLTIVGVAGTQIYNGQAQDTAGNLWNLPPVVVIPTSGTIVVTATAATTGAISAATGTITKIATAIYGWQTVTNASAAAIGAPVEIDAQLRVRQSTSVSLPSLTIFEGIQAAIANLTGVTRSRGYENNTGTTNSNGIPRNTLYFVVEGGAQSDIINAIASKITPGIGTQGSISQTVTDSYGSTRLVKFDTPTEQTIQVAITVHPLSGWSSTTIPVIQAAVAAYLSNLPIGTNVSYTGMFLPAYLPGTIYAGTFSITSLTLQGSGGAAAADVALSYNTAPVSAPANVTITVS
jgi:uncharacterized phage protein gp47/JayE